MSLKTHPSADESRRWDTSQWQAFITKRVTELELLYATSPRRIVSDTNREDSAANDYHGRELLELFQNADDEAGSGDGRIVVELGDEGLVVANTGDPFSSGGLDSLLTPDNSPKQFDRARFIGNKGLGFRSILRWSEHPFISSGSLQVRFDREQSRDWIAELARRHVGITAVLEEYRSGRGSIPVATLARPFALEDLRQLPLGRAVERLRSAERFDTVVSIPFTGAKETAEVREQLEAIGREVLIFTRHLKTLELRTTDSTTRWFVKKRTNETIVLQREGAPAEQWRVASRPGRIPQDHLRPDQQGTPEFEIRVALPEATAVQPRAVLFSYFPTRVALPIPALVHATVELTSNREHLVDSQANRWLVPEIARTLVEAASTLASGEDPFRVLRAVAPFEEIGEDLRRFGFEEALLSALRERLVIPVREGRSLLAEDAALVEERQLDWLPTAQFGDIALWPQAEPLQLLMRRLKLRRISDDELSDRLLTASAGLSVEDLASLLSGVLKLDDRPAWRPPRGLLRDDAGSPVPNDVRVFLPPGEGRNFALPEWLHVRLLGRELSDRLRAALGVTSAEELASRLRARAFEVQDYALQPIASALVAEGERRAREVPVAAEQDAWRRQVLMVIADIRRSYGTQPQPWPSDVYARLPVRNGAAAPANSLYLGGDWPGGMLCERLLPWRPGRLVGSPATLGFAASPEEGSVVLRWIGVATSPRRKAERNIPHQEEFLLYLKGRLAYPAVLEHGEHLAEPAHLDDAQVEEVGSFDLLEDILANSAPEAIIGWMAQDTSLDALRKDGDPDGRLRWPRQRSGRKLVTPSFPSYAVWRLESTAWLPTHEGQREPRQCFLSSGGAGRLRRLLPTPDLTRVEQMRRELGLTSPDIDRALARVGVQASLARLAWDEVYELLLSWPHLDPDGKAASSLYGELLERGDLPEPGPAQDRFRRDGHLWGKEGPRRGYFPIAKLQYEDVGLPSVLSRAIRLVDVPKGRGSERVAKIFLVEAARLSQTRLEVLPIESEPREAELANDVRKLKVWVLALRSHFATEPSLARLDEATVRLLRRATARLTERDGTRDFALEPGDVVLSGGERVVYAIVEEPGPGRLLDDSVIADVVGRAFAQILGIGTEGSADIARLAQCRDDQRERFLAHLIGESRAEVAKRVTDARQRLSAPPEPEPGAPISPPPPDAPLAIPVDGAQTPSTTNAVVTPVPVTTGPVGPVTAEPALLPTPSQKRTIVIRIRATPRTTGGGVGGRVFDPKRREELAERFEEQQGRFPLAVAHLQGSDAPGCDLLSFATAEDRERCRNGFLPSRVLRFIEVKGSAGGSEQLRGNELNCARQYGDHYFLYKVHELGPGRFQLIELAEPTTASLVDVLEVDLLRSPNVQSWDVAEIEEATERGNDSTTQAFPSTAPEAEPVP